MRVLIVEDSITQAMALRNAIMQIRNGEQWQPYIVRRLQEAINSQDSYDVIVLDLSLLDSSCVNTLSRLKEFHVPVVVHTQHNDREILKTIRDAGITQVLFKSGSDLTPNEIRQSILLTEHQGNLSQAADMLRKRSDAMR